MSLSSGNQVDGLPLAIHFERNFEILCIRSRSGPNLVIFRPTSICNDAWESLVIGQRVYNQPVFWPNVCSKK